MRKQNENAVDALGPPSDATVPKIFKKQREISKRGLSAQYENTESCWSFYNADQMSYSDRIQFEDTWGRKRRALVNFNKVQPSIDAVVGFTAQNRRVAKYIAHVTQDQGQQLYTKNMNALADFHRDQTNADQLETEQDLDMYVNGYGIVDSEVSYIVGNSATMPNGNILKNKIDATCGYWDPNAQNKNVIGARWIGYWQDYELRDALKLFQGSEQSDFEQVSDEEPGDTGYTFNPYGGIYDKIKLLNNVEWTSKESEMVRVYKHEWFEFETFYKCDNPLYATNDFLDAQFMKLKMDAIKRDIKAPGDDNNGATDGRDEFDFDPSAAILVFDGKTKASLTKAFGNTIGPITAFSRKVFYTAVISGEHVFTWFKSVNQSGFGIKVKTGTFNRNRKIWMGMVNPMMEPQKYSNKALTELMFTIAANSKGGVMIEEDAVEDVADFESKWAKTDAVIKVRTGALAAGKIQEKTKGAVPTGLENIIQLCDANLAANGVDPSFLGQQDASDQSGILYKRRIRQAISKLGRYFDSITLYQKEDARLMADLIRVWVENNRGEFVRITGKDGSDEFLQVVEDMLAPDYDVTIQEASESMEEKQETALTLSNVAQQFLAAQDPATAKGFLVEALQFMRIDGDVRNRLTQLLQPQQQIDPAQFQQMQQQLQVMQKYIESAQVDKTKSETFKNVATGQKALHDANVSEAKVSQTVADTAWTFEDAKRLSAETHGIHKTTNNQQTMDVADMLHKHRTENIKVTRPAPTK